eukprot:COSAG06_NODE_17092_length_961_cov_1.379350_2_plen_24_part_01
MSLRARRFLMVFLDNLAVYREIEV